MPRYKFDYTLTPQAGGNFLLKVSLSQNEVSEDFIALVPLYADFDGHIVRFGQVRMKGTSTAPEISLPFPKKPKRVLINANHDILERK